MNLVTEHINQINPWFILFFAIMCGSFGTTCLKLSGGFRNVWAVIGVGIGYGFSFTSLTLVLNRIDIGIGYAIWSGLSTIIIVLVGVFFFKEGINFKKVLSLLLIVMGIVGLQIDSSRLAQRNHQNQNQTVESSKSDQ